jgi:uncharacterized protein (DUF58 family)
VSPPGVRPPPFVWLPRGYLFAAGGVVFLAIAIAVRDPLLILLGVPLLIAPVAAVLVSPRPSPSADLAWRATGSEGEVRIEGILRATPPRVTDDLTLSFRRPADFSETAPAQIARWPGRVEFVLPWRSVRPTVQQIPPPLVIWRDPIGLIERPTRGVRSPLPVERFPLDLYRLGAVRLDRTRQLPGRSRTHQIGNTGDFWGIRAADPGEPPRRINWRASARTGRWLANEYELERTGDILVLVDIRPTSLGPVADERFLGLSRAASVGIAGAFLRQKARVGYATFGEFLTSVPLSTGRTQEVRIRQAIRATRTALAEGPSERCAVSMRRFYPPGVTTLLLTTLGDDASHELVVHLRRRGFPSIVLTPSWRSLLSRRARLTAREASLGQRLAQLERRMRLAATRQYASVVDWEDLTSLGDLANLLLRPARRRL